MVGVELVNHLLDRAADDRASTRAASVAAGSDIQRRISFKISFSGVIQLSHCRSFFIEKVGFGSIALNCFFIFWDVEVLHDYLLAASVGETL